MEAYAGSRGAVVPEVIPELVYVIGLFFAVVGYITARGLLATWTHSLGYLLAWLAQNLDFRVSHFGITFHIDIGAPFRAVDTWIVTALQNWCDGAEIEIAYCLHGMAKVAQYTAEAVDFLARETAQTFDALTHIHLPKWSKYALGPLLLALALPKILKTIADHVVHIIVRTVHVVTHEVTHVITSTIPRVAPATIPGLRDLPWIRREVVGFGRWAARVNRRLHRLEGLLGVTALAAAMANVFGLPNWRCLTRGNVGRTVRKLCGLGPAALEDLLGLLADVLLVEDVCQVINLLSDGLTLVEGPLNTIIGGVDSALCHGHFNRPPEDPAVVLSLPPVTGVTLSLA